MTRVELLNNICKLHEQAIMVNCTNFLRPFSGNSTLFGKFDVTPSFFDQNEQKDSRFSSKFHDEAHGSGLKVQQNFSEKRIAKYYMGGLIAMGTPS
jgi:hypothetical protein